MIKDYQIVGKIGKGTFGIVYKVKKVNNPLIYVIKQISLNGLNEQQINQVKTEAKLLSLIKSNYVVKYYESFLENEDLNIVMEYCDNGDLCTYISKQKTPLKEDLIWQMFIKITLGLTTIHKMKILHRDLKTLNIFLKKDMEIKIGDLGVAKELNQASFANTLIGTPYYLSPEMCEDKPYNQKSDVWALGCILYELCTYRHPFNATNHGALILKILKTNPEPILASYSSKLQKLVDEILEKNYEKRPNCWDILNKPVIIEKAKKYGLYQEIVNVFSNNNPIENMQKEIIENKYNKDKYNLTYSPVESEDILFKSQFTAPNNIENKVLVKKLNKDEKRTIKLNQIKRTSISSDKNRRKNNENQKYYNNINLTEYSKNQNPVQYTNVNNFNLINNNQYNNDYVINEPYRNINSNDINIINENYLINDNNNNIYTNITQNNNIIYNPVIVTNRTINYKELESIIDANSNSPINCAKVIGIYKNQPTQEQIISQNNYNDINNEHFEKRKIVDISDSISSLNVSVKPPSIDMDSGTDKFDNSLNNLEAKKDKEDNYIRYPLNSFTPYDNYNNDIPHDNIRNMNKILPLQMISNDNIEIQNNLIINNEIKKNEIENENNFNYINENNNSSTKDSSTSNQQYSDINIINVKIDKKGLNKNSKDISKKKIINENKNNKDMGQNYKVNSNQNSQRKKSSHYSNYSNKNNKKETNQKNPLGDIVNSENKLNKTSINLTASDNFNINIGFQEPIPIEQQMKQYNINNQPESDSDSEDYIILKDNDNNNEDLKKGEQEIPKIDDVDLVQDNEIKIKEEIKSLEKKSKKIRNDMNSLIGEKDFKKIMDLYSKAKNKDNLYVEIEKYADNNKYSKKKKEKLMELYLSLASIDSKIKDNKNY